MHKLLVIVSLVVLAWGLSAADLTGTWNASVVLDAGSGTATFALQQKGEALSGTYSGALGEAKVTGSVKGDDVEWSFDSEDAGKVVYKGKLGADGKIKGECEYGQLGKGSFTAEKK